MLELVDLAQRALILSVVVSLPVVLAAALVSLVAGALQSAIHANDASVSYLPRLLAVAAVLIVAGPWMGGQVVEFAADVFRGR
jgi:flagellar biosynthetic protein FliQ